MNTSANVSDEINDLPERDQLKTLWKAGKWILLVTCPLLLVLGTFGSVMTIMICRRLKLNPATSVYLTALALSDLAVLYFELFLQTWLPTQFDLKITDLYSGFCVINPYLAQVSSALSSWFLVAITAQKAISVIFPLRINVLCTNKKSVLVVCSLTGIILLAYSHMFFISWTDENISEKSSSFCQYRGDYYMYFYMFVWSWADLLIASVVPSVLLLVSNGVLVKKLLTSVREARESLSAGHASWVNDREKQASSLSVMLVIMSSIFLLLALPDRVFVLIYPFLSSDYFPISCFIYHLLRLMHVSNSVVHFYLYCLRAYKFRAEMMKMMPFCRKVKRIPGDSITAKTFKLSTVLSN